MSGTNINSTTKNSVSLTEAQYLDAIRDSELKHEFVNGRAVAMAGASPNHCKLTNNISRLFGNHLQDTPCYPFSSDMRLKTSTGSHRYPDVLVVCDDEFNNDATETPTIIVEVISHSTRKIDEREKFLEYINIETLEEYVLVEQDIVSIIVFRRTNDWRPAHYYIGETVLFDAIDLSLSVAEIYHRVINDDLTAFLAEKNA